MPVQKVCIAHATRPGFGLVFEFNEFCAACFVFININLANEMNSAGCADAQAGRAVSLIDDTKGDAKDAQSETKVGTLVRVGAKDDAKHDAKDDAKHDAKHDAAMDAGSETDLRAVTLKNETQSAYENAKRTYASAVVRSAIELLRKARLSGKDSVDVSALCIYEEDDKERLFELGYLCSYVSGPKDWDPTKVWMLSFGLT